MAESGQAIGPVVLHRAVVGYQELMTDPANTGKILAFTYPLIGNYGVNDKFNESDKAWASGIVMKEESEIYSNFQAKIGLEEFLKKENVAAITGVDTRTLAVKLRDEGEMLGMISSAGLSLKEMAAKIAEFKNTKAKSALSEISVKKITRIGGKGKTLVVIDLGVLKSFIRQLSGLGFEVILAPYDTAAKDILGLKPKAVVISSGPEEDPEISKVVDTVKGLVAKVGLLGISTGHQVIARALGAKITKMKAGHHGANYPVMSEGSLKSEITVQNHSFVVDEKSLRQKGVEIIERNLNDKTIEKMKSKKLKFVSVQYYPLSPGLGEINPLFEEFMKLM